MISDTFYLIPFTSRDLIYAYRTVLLYGTGGTGPRRHGCMAVGGGGLLLPPGHFRQDVVLGWGRIFKYRLGLSVIWVVGMGKGFARVPRDPDVFQSLLLMW